MKKPELREQFEKETGRSAIETYNTGIHLEDMVITEYIEWLEQRTHKLESEQQECLAIIDAAIEKNKSLTDVQIALTSKYYARDILNEIKTALKGIEE